MRKEIRQELCRSYWADGVEGEPGSGSGDRFLIQPEELPFEPERLGGFSRRFASALFSAFPELEHS
jgi:hypothetical protein